VGILEFLVFAVIVVLLAYFAIWVLGKLAPGHPVIVDNILWVVAVGLIVLRLVEAMGLLGMDPKIPRVR
jgi:hypothetical protein